MVSRLDCKSGYWRVDVAENDREKTAFTTGNGLWQYNVMAFGLCNVPATFERLMDTTLGDLKCLIYLDDIIVHAMTFDLELRRLRLMFSRLRAANLRLSPKKCELFPRKIKFFVTDRDKEEAVQNWPVPHDAKDVRRFDGVCTFDRRFVRSFSNVARPLRQLCEIGHPFKWTKECNDSFQQLKAALESSPVLVYPESAVPFLLDTDASNVGIGAVLSQVHNGEERVIAY